MFVKMAIVLFTSKFDKVKLFPHNMSKQPIKEVKQMEKKETKKRMREGRIAIGFSADKRLHQRVLDFCKKTGVQKRFVYQKGAELYLEKAALFKESLGGVAL